MGSTSCEPRVKADVVSALCHTRILAVSQLPEGGRSVLGAYVNAVLDRIIADAATDRWPTLSADIFELRQVVAETCGPFTELETTLAGIAATIDGAGQL